MREGTSPTRWSIRAVAVLDDDAAEDGAAAFLVMELLEGDARRGVRSPGRQAPARAVLAVAYQCWRCCGGRREGHRPSRHQAVESLSHAYGARQSARLRRRADARSGLEHATMSGLAWHAGVHGAEQALGKSAEVDGSPTCGARRDDVRPRDGGPVHRRRHRRSRCLLCNAKRASSDRSSPRCRPQWPSRGSRAGVPQVGALAECGAMRDAVKRVYRAQYGEDPSPAALVFMASPEKMPVPDRSPMLRSPMASTVPETPVSIEPRRLDDRLGGSNPTSLVATAAQPRTSRRTVRWQRGCAGGGRVLLARGGDEERAARRPPPARDLGIPRRRSRPAVTAPSGERPSRRRLRSSLSRRPPDPHGDLHPAGRACRLRR